MTFFCHYSAALENTKKLEELQYNFSVAGPASLELLGRSEDPVGVAHKLYRHYLDTTHVTKAHAEGFMKVSSNVRQTNWRVYSSSSSGSSSVLVVVEQ